jgi:cytoskeletal protein RodZ
VTILEESRDKRYPIDCAETTVRLKEGRRREMPFDLGKIGQLLKNTREEKGLTLDQVSNALFIKKRVIVAIESGDWDSLPYPVYVKGYVNQYAALLDIADLIEAGMISPEKQPSPEVQGVAAALKSDGARKRWALKSDGASNGWGLKKKVMIVSALGALVVGFLVFQNLHKKAYVAPPAQRVESSHQTFPDERQDAAR